MIRIAITGGIACGKSLVGEIFSDLDVPVCDADYLAHSLMLPGKGVYDKVVEKFGKSIIAPNGNIDRKKLGEIVFADEQLRLALNKIVHPAVKDLLEDWLCKHNEFRAAAVIIPLLYVAKMENGWDAVICVSCSDEVQLKRLIGRGLSDREARQRISAQLPTVEKMSHADYVIFNDGTVLMLKKQVEKVLRHVLEK